LLAPIKGLQPYKAIRSQNPLDLVYETHKNHFYVTNLHR